jgi:hypothetical protein
MANTYPAIAGGDDITADLLASMLPMFTVKSSATTRTSTTTLADDPELTLTLAANAKYFVELFLCYGAINAEKFKTAWKVPSGVTGTRFVMGPGSSANQGSMDNVSMRAGAHLFTTAVTYGTRDDNTGGCLAEEKAVIITGASSGTFALQWAQATSGSTGTSLFESSFMRVTRLA